MAQASSAGRRPRVVVVGAGFGGINAAMALGKMAVDVTVVDKKNHHTSLQAAAVPGGAGGIVAGGDCAADSVDPAK